MKKLKFSRDTISQIIFFVIAVMLVILRINIVLGLPIYGYIDYIDDDQLQVHQAKSLLEGKWLGNYGYNTLLKGPVFPIFLAFICFFKIPYIFSITFVYTIACCIFIYSIKDIIKNKFALLIILAFMLFNPIMFSSSFQRVYRNSLTPTLAITLMSFFNIALVSRNQNNTTKYTIGLLLASIIFPFFYYVREDSIWLVPFILFYSFIMLSNIISDFLKTKKFEKIQILKILLLALPLLTLILFEQIVGNINLSYYGGKVVNQNNFESLNNVMHSINIVKNPDNNIEVTNSRSKIKQLYTISPSLNKIKDNFEFSLNILTGEENGEISDGMFGWAFLSGVSMSHYSTYKEQTELFDSISTEINTAIKNNVLETQELVPIFQDSLKLKFNFKDLFLNINQAMYVINDYNSIKLMDTFESKVNYSDFYETRIREFLEITHDKILLEDGELNSRIFGELVTSSKTEYIESMEPKIKKLNDIRTFYNDTANTIKILGYSSYIIMTILLIVDLILKKEKDILNNWLIASGIIGSVFTLATGVAYTSLVKIPLTNSFYLMSGYILNNVFCLICIITIINYFYKIITNKIKKKNEI